MIKNRYLFILGRQADIALAEVLATLKNRQIRYEPERLSPHELVISTDQPLVDTQKLLDGLGGTIKVVQLDDQLPLKRSSEFRAEVLELLKPDTIAREYASQKSGRWTFGISLFTGTLSQTDRKKLATIVHRQGLVIKEYFKSKKRSTRFVTPRGQALDLSSVVIRKNKLLPPDGIEINLLFAKNSLLRGHTLAVQDFEAYSGRDYGRPARDPRIGSLPPKLAQILLNLSGLTPQSRIHDPFVGIGTILQEGLLMGYKMSGSDNDQEQIERTKKNLAWLRRKYPNLPAASDKEVFLSDAIHLKLPGGANSEKIDGIVTEGILGPPQSRPVQPEQAENIVRGVAGLWQASLKNWSALLPKGGMIVATWPVIKTTAQDVFTPLLDDLASLGYRVDPLLPDSLFATSRLTKRQTLVYERPDQIVRREIVRLAKK